MQSQAFFPPENAERMSQNVLTADEVIRALGLTLNLPLLLSAWLETEGPRVWASPVSLHCGPWARHIYPSLVLVQPRKTHPCFTKRLLLGRKESNQTNKHYLKMLSAAYTQVHLRLDIFPWKETICTLIRLLPWAVWSGSILFAI